IELAARFEKGDILAITGTNGKTTTTTLVGEIMKNYAASTGKKEKVYVVGNIGEPYTEIADLTTDKSVTVAEISSFQLETTKSFAPRVSAILNITPDHLNRHKTMAEYVRVKERIAEKQGPDDTIVLNYDDALTRDFGRRAGCKVVYFTRNTDFAQENGEFEFLHIKDGMIMYNDTDVIGVDDMLLIGSHNHENVMAAVGMCLSYGVPLDIIRDTVRTFHAVEHRIEFVKTVDGVDYYNDSKGTNPDAAIKAVQAMKKPTILIGGGYDKASAYDEWIESFGDKVKCLVLIGQTAEKIAECARKHGFNEIVMAEDLKAAVDICHERAKDGYAVLLSPACASWGMFTNYEERGHKFKEYVKSL
ncbi:MAG: UDP-N-acetylmuramoyl-L-alanine--D-glutamate ligase, partial [Lachnospiraceae bacterium]|nr:UDP-N-acetylmuramoyl-L-alanine--D-glutamate ligase [Lachnospiraceae bacterium]